MPQSYCHVLCEHVSMADMVSGRGGGANRRWFVSFHKGRTGRHLLGHRGISRKAFLDSEYLKTLLPGLSLGGSGEISCYQSAGTFNWHFILA